MNARGTVNPAIRAINVLVDVGGRQVKAIIPGEVLESRLHSSPGPEGWLTSYEEHASEIDDKVRRRFAAREQDFVVVRSSDFGELGD